MTEELKNKIKMTLKTISKPVTKTWNATSGYKTATATVIGLVLRAIDGKFPNLLNDGTEAIILDFATVLGTLGIGDKLTRFIKNLFKKKKEKE